MYDSSFPTPFPLPQPKLSHSLGSRNTECKHFFPTRGNTMVSGHSRNFAVDRRVLFLLILGDEISKSWNGKAALKEDEFLLIRQ